MSDSAWRSSRRQFLAGSGAALAAAAAASASPAAAYAARAGTPSRPPNIVLVMADDLGFGELGAYGQQLMRTPTLDRLAAEGLRFTDFYAGGPVCAPSRCAMLTGLHTGHCTVRENPNQVDERSSLLPTDVTFAELVRSAGYRTACIGKWGFGVEQAGQPSHPNERGFDEFFGYITHVHAHDYYPSYLWQDGARVEYPENQGAKVTYAPELFVERSVEFIQRNREQPFLLFFSPTLPHAPPDVPSLGEYADRPWSEATKAHAAQVTLLDAQVGRVVDALTQAGVVDDTLVVFVGDNGPHEEGPQDYDPEFLDANGPLRGVKRNLYEGGIRVPAIAWSPGLLAQASPDAAGRPWTVWDLYPTFAELAGAPVPGDLDGTSMGAALTAGRPSAERPALYWYRRDRGAQAIANATDGGRLQDVCEAVRQGSWKALRFAPGRDRYVPGDEWAVELYDLAADVGETTDVAARHPDVAAALVAVMRSAWVEPGLGRDTFSPHGLTVAPPRFLVAGETRELTTRFTNHEREACVGLELGLAAPAGWTVRAMSSPAFAAVAPGGSVEAAWSVTPPAGAEPAPDRGAPLEITPPPGGYPLAATASCRRGPGSDAVTVPMNLVPAPPAADAFLSDMVWIRAENGYGPVELDRSNGTNAAGDGGPISLAGRRYAKGLGTHAESKLAYYTGGGFSRFAADVGIDDFPSSGGSVQFYVFGDGEQLDTTGILTRATGPRSLDVPIAGVQVLELVATNASGTGGDHASWADARVLR